MSDDDRKASDSIIRGEFHDALRFCYGMATQGQVQIDNIDTIVGALVEVLIKSGKLDRRDVEALLPKARRALQDQRRHEISVDVARNIDKYKSKGPDDLDCAALIPICKGRCCKLTFALSFQDLDEGVVRWDYAEPYRILHGDDAHCVHSSPKTRGCTIYEHRPSICRVYDCRKDERIWLDFDKRIPAPDEAISARPPRLYKIRRPLQANGPSRMEDAVELEDDEETGDE